MSSKGKKPQMQAGNTRLKSSGALAQAQHASSSTSIITAFSDELPQQDNDGTHESLFAQVSQAVDVDTLRIFQSSSATCIARWASSSSSDRITSIAWVHLSMQTAMPEGQQQSTSKSKKRRKSSSGGTHFQHTQDTSTTIVSTSRAGISRVALAIGLASGHIHILNPVNSSIIHTLSHSTSTEPIRSMSYAETDLGKASHLWSCASNGQIFVWNLPDLGGNGGRLSALHSGIGDGWSEIAVRYLANPPPSVRPNSSAQDAQMPGATHVDLLVAQHAIKCLRVELPSVTPAGAHEVQNLQTTLVASFTGHTTKVVQLVWFDRRSGQQTSKNPDIRFLSVAHDDRFVNVWNGRPDPHQRREGQLVATFNADDDILRAALADSGDMACAITQGSLAAIFALPPTIFSDKPVETSKKKHKASVNSLHAFTTVSASRDQGNLTNACFIEESRLRISYGLVKPSVDTITLRSPDDTYPANIALAARGQPGLYTSESSSTSAQRQTLYSETTGSAIANPSPNPPAAPSGQSHLQNGIIEEPVLEQRLKRLDFDSVNGGKTMAQLVKKSKQHARPATREIRVIQSASLAQSLVQALHSSDTKLLESCLHNKDTNIIRTTIRRLPNTLVVPLVEVLVDRLGRKNRNHEAGNGGVDASRGQQLIFWLQTVLMLHLPYLVTLPHLVNRLAGLHATLESRMSFHNQLLALNGRLDLVVSQIELRGQSGIRSSKKGAIPAEPSRYIEGGESSESETEDPVPMAPQDEEVEDLLLEQGSDSDDSGQEALPLNRALLDEDEDAMLRRRSKGRPGAALLPPSNGFVDTEAEESEDEDEGSDIDAAVRRSMPNGVAGSDEEDEEDDGENLDRYESDFINDEEEDDEDDGDEAEDNDEGDDE